MLRAKKITIELEDGSTQYIEGESAILFQARVNRAGILAGIDITEELLTKEEK